MNMFALNAGLGVLELIRMGEVAVTLQIMPEGVEVNLKKLREEVKSRIEPRSVEEEPVAFGLKPLKVLKIVPDEAGGTDQLEDDIAEIGGVRDVRVVDQRKIF